MVQIALKNGSLMVKSLYAILGRVNRVLSLAIWEKVMTLDIVKMRGFSV